MNAFFFYAYLSLLESPSKYENRLKESSTALPESILDLFRYMNQTINSDRIMFPFKFAGIFEEAIER